MDLQKDATENFDSFDCYPSGSVDASELKTDITYVVGHLKDGMKLASSNGWTVPNHFVSALEWVERIEHKLAVNDATNNKYG